MQAILNRYIILSVILFVAMCSKAQYVAPAQLQKQLNDTLHRDMDSLSAATIVAGNDYLFFPEYVKNYYRQNNYRVVWIKQPGIIPLCDSLVYLIHQSYYEGLNPYNYHLGIIESLRHSILEDTKNRKQSSAEKLVSLEILLTDAFITYASDLYAGHIHTENENVEWKQHMQKINPLDSLNKIMEKNTLKNILNNFSCMQPGYIQLKEILQKAISRHDGIYPLVSDTLASLSIILLNMERWRWLPHNMNQSYIMINIADFTMDVSDSDKTVMSMKIIVGKTYTRTPLFDSKMLYIVINPWWEIPQNIAKKEILPAIKKNKNYLAKNNICVYESWETDAREIDADSIKWDSITSYNLSYHFRQQPGAGNALGHIKFMFPNKYNVYLHDTPQPELFLKDKRTFSHGCIRIEKPLELAEYLLKSDSSWTKETLLAAFDTSINQTVVLPRPINVYICYWTAWIDASGKINLRPDIYGYDKRLLEQMEAIDFSTEP